MKRCIWTGLLALLPALLLAAPALAGDVRGVTDTEILIGQWGPQTGPAALWGAVARGTDLYFKMINEAGGVNGRQIKYFLRDDAYNPANTKAIGKEFVEKLGVFAVVGGVGTGPGMAVRDYLAENNVPWVSPSTGSKHWTDPLQKNIFAVYPRYVDESYLLAKYSYENLGKKIALFYQNDDYGKEGLAGAQKALQELGTALVAEVSVEVPDTDLSSHALKLKESGAEVVIMFLLPKHAAIILGECAKLGYKPQWVSSNTLSDAPLMTEITKGLWKGVICSSFGDTPDADNELMKKYRAAHQKFAPKERWGTFFAAGILFAEPLVEGLTRAGKDLTPESFYAAMETIKDWRGIGPPLTFTADDHQGAKSVFIAKVDENGTLVKISDWITITK
ncbi:MAG: ABC transporter substrate-binding protein [Thermodesulfobacteriota bacterium]